MNKLILKLVCSLCLMYTANTCLAQAGSVLVIYVNQGAPSDSGDYGTLQGAVDFYDSSSSESWSTAQVDSLGDANTLASNSNDAFVFLFMHGDNDGDVNIDTVGSADEGLFVVTASSFDSNIDEAYYCYKGTAGLIKINDAVASAYNVVE